MEAVDYIQQREPCMNGEHDIGGRHGFGRIEHTPDDPTFHERWEARVFAIALSSGGSRGGVNLDAARHRGERLDPVAYFRNGYYGRWLAALELGLQENGFLAPGELDAWQEAFAARHEGHDHEHER